MWQVTLSAAPAPNALPVLIQNGWMKCHDPSAGRGWPNVAEGVDPPKTQCVAVVAQVMNIPMGAWVEFENCPFSHVPPPRSYRDWMVRAPLSTLTVFVGPGYPYTGRTPL